MLRSPLPIRTSGSIGSMALFFGDARRLAALLSVTLLALAVRIPMLGSAYTAPDTDQYLDVAKGVFHGGFENSYRPPAYASLLAIFELVGIDPIDGVVVLQNVVGIVLPALVVLVGWRYFNPVAGVMAGILMATSPLTIAVEQFALSDYLFGVILFLGAVLLTESAIRLRAEREGWELLAAAGATFGLATLLRANGLIGFFAIPLVLLIAAKGWRPALRPSVVAMAAMAIVLAPWCIHNLIRFDDPNVASERGVALYARSVSWAERPPSPDTANGRLALSVYNTGDSGKVEGAVGTTTGVYNAFIREGKTPIEASAAMGVIAREVIVGNPVAYAEDTVENLGLYQDVLDPHTFTTSNRDQIFKTRDYFRALNPTATEIPGDSQLTRIPWQIGQSLTNLLFILTIGGLLILLLPFVGSERSRLAAATMLIVGLVAIVGVSLTARPEQRYIISLLPFIWILATATVVQLATLLVAVARQLPRGRPQGEAA